MVFVWIAHYIDDFSPKAKATIAGITVNYPLTTQKDGCSYLENTRCPLEQEEYVSYTFKMFVSKVFPKVNNLKQSSCRSLYDFFSLLGFCRYSLVISRPGWSGIQLLLCGLRCSRWAIRTQMYKLFLVRFEFSSYKLKEISFLIYF